MLGAHKLWVGVGWWAALGCGGSAVDLGERDTSGFKDVPRVTPDPTRPQTVYEDEVRIYGFTADDTTLYALLDRSEDVGLLVSCPIERCKSERSILAKGIAEAGSSPLGTPLLQGGDWLYWRHGSGSPARGIAACPKSGCASLERVESELTGELVSDGEYVYWFDYEGKLLRWKAGGGSGVETLGALNPASGQRLVVSGDYVYFSGPERQGISRIHKRGSGEVEPISQANPVSSLAVSGAALYYTSRILAGEVRSCPLAGGEGAGRVLVGNQRWPSSLQSEGGELFWVNAIASRQVSSGQTLGALLSCPASDCGQPRTWHRDFVLPEVFETDADAWGNRFVVTAQSLWWLESAQGFGSALRRLPR